MQYTPGISDGHNIHRYLIPEAVWFSHGVISLHTCGLIQVDGTQWSLREVTDTIQSIPPLARPEVTLYRELPYANPSVPNIPVHTNNVSMYMPVF